MTTLHRYIKPEIVEVPYDIQLLDIAGSTGADVIIDDNETNIFSKEFDFEEENFDNDLWEHEREDFGLHEWDEE